MKTLIIGPRVALAGWLVAAIGFAGALFFYFDGRREPRLSYFTKSVRTAVFEPGHSQELRLSHNGKEINARLTAAEIVFWNDGKMPIAKAEVLKPATIRTGSGGKIVDAKIKRVVRDVSGFTIVATPGSRSVRLAWNIIEPGDGCSIQIVYEGGYREEILMEGAVVGQRELVRLKVPEGTVYRDGFDPSARKAAEKYMLVVFIFSGATIFLVIIAGKEMMPNIMRVVCVSVLLVCMIIIGKDLIWGYVEPPFGF